MAIELMLVHDISATESSRHELHKPPTHDNHKNDDEDEDADPCTDEARVTTTVRVVQEGHATPSSSGRHRSELIPTRIKKILSTLRDAYHIIRTVTNEIPPQHGIRHSDRLCSR